MLTGTEVKSLRAGRATLTDGFAQITDGEVWLHGVHIPEYTQGTWTNHEPRRIRKLLLHRKEIDRLARATSEGGLTLIPLSLYFSGREGQDRAGAGARSANLRQAAGTGPPGRHPGGRACHAAPKVAQWRLMAGMARRGAHSARHRAERSDPDAASSDAQPDNLPAPGAESFGPGPDGGLGFGQRQDTWPGPGPGAEPGWARADGFRGAASGPGRFPFGDHRGRSPGRAAATGPAEQRGRPVRPHPAGGPKKRKGRSRSTMIRLGSLLCAAAVVIIAGLTGVGQSDPSVAASVKNFLLAWEIRQLRRRREP